MEVTLDLTRLTDRVHAHLYLQEQFDFPDWYGKNLDALYDCLTEYPPCRIVLANGHVTCDGCAPAILDTIRDAAAENPALELVCFDLT